MDIFFENRVILILNFDYLSFSKNFKNDVIVPLLDEVKFLKFMGDELKPFSCKKNTK
jgi:hypothetical protein